MAGLHVLHIANDFANPLYANLAAGLQARGVRQTVLSVVYESTSLHSSRSAGVEVIPIPILTAGIRPFLRIRTRRALAAISDLDLSDIDVVHSHTLFSDGLIGDEIASGLSVPHITTVRNTDRHVHYKYRRSLRKAVRGVAKRAHAVVCIGPGYQPFARSALRVSDVAKVKVINNGIDDFWVRRMQPLDDRPASTHARLLFVGSLDRNKNLSGLLNAARILADTRATEVRIVGGRDRDRLPTRDISAARASGVDVRLYGRVESKHALLEHYRWADVVVLPSFRETFGLVLAEGLSQGKPGVCSAGEGISGLLPPGAGLYDCDPKYPQSIAAAVRDALNPKPGALADIALLEELLSWESVAARFSGLYSESLGLRPN